MSEKLLPKAPITLDYCVTARNAASALLAGAKTVAEREHWHKIEAEWTRRIAEAEAREVV